MKITIDRVEVLELSETQKKVIQNDIPQDIFENDMLRRCKYWLEAPCDKYVHKRKLKIEKALREKNHKTFPTNLLKLGRKYVDEFPSLHGHDHIIKPLKCEVGTQIFELSMDHQYVWTKILEPHQEKRSKEEYISYEKTVLENRMAWILQHKYERCLERLKREWVPKLEERGITEIPSDDDEFANLVFSQEDYKDRYARDQEELALRSV